MGSPNQKPEVEAFETLGRLCEAFAYRSSAHGIPRIVTAKGVFRKLMWLCVFVIAVSGFGYHSIVLITTYLSYPRLTTTDEVHATEIEFPSVTVCNVNSLKKEYFEKLFPVSDSSFPSQLHPSPIPSESNIVKPIVNKDMDNLVFKQAAAFKSDTYTTDDETVVTPNICLNDSIDDFISKSRTMDLSDMWMNLVANKETLSKYGHRANDLIVQCTYNSRNCFNGSFSIVNIETTPSPRFGLCHTISVRKEQMRRLKKTGSTFGLRLTLNIERDDYMDQIVPEYGARLLVHAFGTIPSLQQGGIILRPGIKSYVSIKMYCQALCQEAELLQMCGCLGEISREVNCRRQFFRKSAMGNTKCFTLCKPACQDIRYDMTVSQSDWPSLPHQAEVLRRWPNLNWKLANHVITHTPEDPLSLQQEEFQYHNHKFVFDVDSIRRNLLRVHIYLQEMNYFRVKDEPGYTLPQLFADLGGCLGLYIGVSAITIVEILEHFTSIIKFLYVRRNRAAVMNHELSPSKIFSSPITKPKFRNISIQVTDANGSKGRNGVRQKSPLQQIQQKFTLRRSM
ncbi:FMRFamide-activated amiloride-sensitive sodium channel-like [Limulus polyphemus]|uniref:FMRFamide-activated amiloride-sensitive sodium channel-like n=1 Tax=Limulus polyphemus TaxID=6850 RepID=A0ABM1S9X0_LIMPO|nr:FMRFamide-activated amiloride-sensitive sodium channel-like [Limulus polyphemus]